MRVVSLVPSLTETMIVSGAEIVGRTRYCVHPGQARSLPVVGGTKDLDWERFKSLKPDLLLLDKEENLPWMQEQSPCPVHVFHATGIDVMAGEMRSLADCFSGETRTNLLRQSERWQRVQAAPSAAWNWNQVPTESRRRGPDREWRQVLYMIWKNPWMGVAGETFVASVLRKLGAPVAKLDALYPTLELDKWDPETTLLLFSSEPFPFEKKWDDLAGLPHTQVLVDGESFSWFGVRSLQFLEDRLFGPG